MLLLLIIAIIGFVLSFLLHFLTVFHAYYPPKEFTMVIYAGLIFLIYPVIFITKKKREEAGIPDTMQSLKNTCPKWLSGTTGLLIFYALIDLSIQIFKRNFDQSMGPDIVTSEEAKRFSGHWMALYALTVSMLYSAMHYTKDVTEDAS